MIQWATIFGTSGGGIDYDVSAVTTLPEVATNDKIVVITDTLPPLANGIIIDTIAPPTPVAGMIYIHNGAGPLAITQQGSNVSLIIRPGDAMQYNGAVWMLCNAYIGVGSTWVQFSVKKLLYTYTGTHTEYEDDNYVYIKLLTSGVFTPLSNHAVDVFAVGGGGAGGARTQTYYASGGGGGYTSTVLDRLLMASQAITATIGGGGAGATVAATRGGTGGTTSFGSIISALGGQGGISRSTGDGANHGGSGGAAGSGGAFVGPQGGSDGADGTGYNAILGGTGQHATTRAFGDPNGELYAGGGSGAGGASTTSPGGDGGGGYGAASGQSTTMAGGNGAANTGGGGGAGASAGNGGNGGSGIIILRYAK